MKKVNLNNIPWVERKSPKGKYHRLRRNVALAFKNPKTGPRLPGPPPFEVELIRVPPKARHCPFHSHTTEWEFYLIVSGTGLMRLAKKAVRIRAGDCLLNPPGEAHQLINTGKRDLVYYVIANNAPTDVWHYPDSNKWGSPAMGKFFRLQETSYYDGEE